MIRVVVFDLGGVVFPSPFPVMEEVERAHGLPPMSIARVIRRSGEQGAWAALERGEISAEDFDGRFREDWLRHGVGGASFRGGTLLEALGKASFGGEVDAGVDALLREMRVMRGVRAVALTNNWRGSISREQLLALEQRFDLVIQSCLAGCRKPEPRIYAHALERIRQSLPGCADVMPHEIAFLDDLGSNLKPARLLGMHTIHVAPSRPLADALLELRDGESVESAIPKWESFKPVRKRSTASASLIFTLPSSSAEERASSCV